MEHIKQMMQQREKTRKKRGLIIGILIVAIVLAAAGTVTYLKLQKKAKENPIPDRHISEMINDWKNRYDMDAMRISYSDYTLDENGNIASSADYKMVLSDPELIGEVRDSLEQVTVSRVVELEEGEYIGKELTAPYTWEIIFYENAKGALENGERFELYGGYIGDERIEIRYAKAEDEETIRGYLCADSDIREIVKKFITKHQKSLTMKEVEGMFGKKDLTWRDFECYAEPYPDDYKSKVDLKNGWVLEITRTKEEANLYQLGEELESVILRKGDSAISKDIREADIAEFWERNR